MTSCYETGHHFIHAQCRGHQDSPNVQVGLNRVQQYMLFFLFQNKDSLVPQMGNVIAIGLTPSRTGIVIGHLLNAQLSHMSVRAAWRHK